MAVLTAISIVFLGTFLLQQYRHKQFLVYEKMVLEEKNASEKQQFELISKTDIYGVNNIIENEEKIGGEYSAYSKDKNHAFFCSKILEDENPRTFRL